MKTIWKYTLLPRLIQSVLLPKGAVLLTVQRQHDEPQLWFVCNPPTESDIPEQRYIAIYGTGSTIPDDPGKYIATFQNKGGAFIYHVFEMNGTT